MSHNWLNSKRVPLITSRHEPHRKQRSSLAVQLFPLEHICLRSRYSVTAVVYLLITRTLPSNGSTYYNIVLLITARCSPSTGFCELTHMQSHAQYGRCIYDGRKCLYVCGGRQITKVWHLCPNTTIVYRANSDRYIRVSMWARQPGFSNYL
jgi:hypothetical protein